jgi:hypothetical protein
MHLFFSKQRPGAARHSLGVVRVLTNILAHMIVHHGVPDVVAPTRGRLVLQTDKQTPSETERIPLSLIHAYRKIGFTFQKQTR